MENLEFRKYLTTYGISVEEHEGMPEEKKQELINGFNQTVKAEKAQRTGENIKTVGETIKGIGCLMMMVPLLIVCVIIIFSLF
jgi:hypothetical protein